MPLQSEYLDETPGAGAFFTGRSASGTVEFPFAATKGAFLFTRVANTATSVTVDATLNATIQLLRGAYRSPGPRPICSPAMMTACLALPASHLPHQRL
jgi:hypothetical protein